MRVRIIKAIPTPRLEGFDVSDYREGMVYETGRSIREVLFAYGYAVPEEGRGTTRRPRPNQRPARGRPVRVRSKRR